MVKSPKEIGNKTEIVKSELGAPVAVGRGRSGASPRYWFKRGVVNNPNGRPKGSVSLKEFAREYLLSVSDDEKTKFLNHLPPEVIWKMAEGNPHNTEDVRHTVVPTPIVELDILKVSGVDNTVHVLPSADSETGVMLDASPPMSSDSLLADSDTPSV